MVMGPVKPVKQSRATATRVAALLVLPLLGATVSWSQQAAPLPNDSELNKQETIYRSQGTAIPSGYVTGRALSDYVDALPSGFCDALRRLRGSDRWLDVGAGAGHAVLDYFAADGQSAATDKCAGSGVRARAVAISIEDRRTDADRERAAKLGDRVRYLAGKRLREYPVGELGKFQLITDVYGAFSYTEDLSAFMEKVLGLLETDGTFYSLVQSVHLEYAKDSPDTGYQTELFDAAGRDVTVCSWLKRGTCVNVTCESKSDWHTPTELISIRKVCPDASVPPVKLLKYEAGSPPGRKFTLAPKQ